MSRSEAGTDVVLEPQQDCIWILEMSRRFAAGGLRKTHARLQLNGFEFWDVSSGSMTKPEYSSHTDANGIRIYSVVHGKCYVALKT